MYPASDGSASQGITAASTAALHERLAPDAASLLRPYLEHSGATAADLAAITDAGPRPPFLDGLRRAEQILGPALLRTVVGRLGWPRLAYGFHVETLDAVSVDGSFPFVVPRAVARLLSACGSTQTGWQRHLVVAHGCDAQNGSASPASGSVQRFRSYNVAHAQLLEEILAVAPVDLAKVHRIATLLERVVTDFAALFQGMSDDARRVVELFTRLRAAVDRDLERDLERGELSGDTVRRVQSFEDPARLDDVTTLHGLKRYLHQQGLRLAFRLFGSQSAANRTVDLVVTGDREVLRHDRVLKYLEFEPTPLSGGARLPFAVSLLAEALGLQALHGRKLPWVTLLGYGNELQVYVHYRNHPAFIRIDLSPPFRGGLIDLEYFAVSQYELDQHPDLSLQGIQRVLRELEFDVSKEGLRLHARYDKERAVDLGDVVAKARSLFRLLPHLMDVDWTIGDLDYPAAARAVIGDAWARFFARWGVLPIPEALSADRRKVLVGIEPDPAGPREVFWNGLDHYRDRFTDRPGPEFTDALRKAFDRRGLGAILDTRATAQAGTGQCTVEQTLLAPLRAALDRGEVSESDAEFAAAPGMLFRRDHEAERLAALLGAPNAELAQGVEVAHLARSVERQARFVTTGSVDGYAVQAAVLPTAPHPVSLFVLRDDQGIVRVAIASAGGVLYRTRSAADSPWTLRDAMEPAALAAVLRTYNYLGEAPPLLQSEIVAEVEEIRARFAAPSASPVEHHAGDDWIVPAFSAAPGWAAGFARFGSVFPSDLRGAVLVSQAVRPEDAPVIRHAAAIVSTGGGILSHVGLIALELEKPAVIIDGRWSRTSSGAPVLLYRRPQWQERECAVARRQVVCRNELYDTEETLQQGDLVAVDGDTGQLVVLGHDPQVIALHQDLYQLAVASAALAATRSDAEILAGRGALIRAAHQLDRLLSRIERPALARHAVRELLSFAPAPSASEGRAARARLLSTLLRNPSCQAIAREAAASRVGALHARLEASRRRAVEEIAQLGTPGEILFLRQAVWRMDEMLRDALAVMGAPDRIASGTRPPEDVDRACAARLAQVGVELTASIERCADVAAGRWRLRHVLPSLRHVREALPGLATAPGTARAEALERELALTDADTVAKLRGNLLLGAGSGGVELRPLVGGKAANLGEIVRTLGPEIVPPWFVVTDTAFRAALALPLASVRRPPGGTGQSQALSDLIAGVMSQREWDPRRQAAAIRDLWLDATLPETFADQLAAAYRSIGVDPGKEPFVAIRSSACEEDTQESAWAGQFDTFLFVRGLAAVLEHVKLAWAGFWTERAILQRRALGLPAAPRGGGVLVQRMVDPRASGVLHTVSAATGQLREMVVIAGLGVGEGIVSGTVDVDTILVSKEGDLERRDPRVRYRIGDKREQLVHDTVRGSGTRRAETAYHQRFRAALEYVELRELVRAALRLERTFLSPLDVEFAVDQQGVRVVQARPVALFETARRETIAAQPLDPDRAATREEP